MMSAVKPLMNAPRRNGPPMKSFSSKPASARPKKPSSASRPSTAKSDAMQANAQVTILDRRARFCRGVRTTRGYALDFTRILGMPISKLGTFRATISGFCLIAIGLCFTRWAYTPLVPSMIDGGWVDKPEAGYLGGFNSLGYMIGCVIAIRGTRWRGPRGWMRFAILLAIASVAMGIVDLGFTWLATARLAAGVAGAICIIHAPGTMLQQIEPRRRAACSGIAFAGAGVMIVLTSLLLPLVLHHGASAGWMFETGLTVLMGWLAWPLVSTASSAASRTGVATSREPLDARKRHLLSLLAIAYVLAAVGVTPHTLFLADYLHRDLGVSVAGSSSLFAVLGAGCAVGSLTSGVAARRIGTLSKLVVAYLLGLLAVLIVLLFESVTLVTISSFLMGVFLLQCVPLTSIRTLEIVGLDRHAAFWGLMAISFGGGLAIGGYGMSGMLALGFEYIDLFVVAAVALVAGVGLIGRSWFRRMEPIDSEA